MQINLSNDMLGNKLKLSSVGLFPCKLMDMIDYAEQQGLDEVISWTSDGRAFNVNNSDMLVMLLPRFFGQTKYASFQRQLHLWSFEKVREGSDRGAMAHPFFIRGRKAILQNMSRESFKRRSVDKTMKVASKEKLTDRTTSTTNTLINTPNWSVNRISSDDLTNKKSAIVSHLKSKLIVKRNFLPDCSTILSDSILSGSINSKTSLQTILDCEPNPIIDCNFELLEQKELQVQIAQDADLVMEFEGRQFYCVDSDEVVNHPSLLAL